ncbi:MAG: DUF427 domain-containing protein [Rhodospirillaceae bacterium]|nr:DUF427 domain-containing protein [Rhodospirillaceae bacterium]
MSDDINKRIVNAKKDGYRIDIKPHGGRARAVWQGVVIADSAQAVVLEETRHAPVIYFPRADARMDLMHKTAHKTHCPFKGDASYFSLKNDQTTAENAVWSYENPIPEAAAIRGYLAFYTQAMGAHFGIEIKS